MLRADSGLARGELMTAGLVGAWILRLAPASATHRKTQTGGSPAAVMASTASRKLITACGAKSPT